MKSRIFIGSSSKAIPYAKMLGELLKQNQNLLPVVWDENGTVFKLATTYIESLTTALANFDYAIMVFHPDDSGVIKGKKVITTRDNVVFEYGLFIGKLGRDKCYIVQPENIDLRIPSDLMGVNNATYKFLKTKDEERIKELMQSAASEISTRIQEVNKIRIRPPKNMQVIDGYLHMATTLRKTYAALEDSIRDGITLPEEILYWSVESANAWLNYEQEAFENANQALGLVAREMDKLANDENINFISLGCGSGAKDVLIINMLSPNERSVSYFPIDQSYTLLETAIEEMLNNINADDLSVKGIRADFRRLSSFSNLFYKANAINIFSFLGSTLGNYEEAKILGTISECMRPNDMLILEVGDFSEDLGNKENGAVIESGKYADRKLQDFLLAPVKAFISNTSKEYLKFIIEKENVTIKDSVRVIVRYDNPADAEQHPFDIAFSTHYKSEELKKFLLDNHELETIFERNHKKNIYLLCRKKAVA